MVIPKKKKREGKKQKRKEEKKEKSERQYISYILVSRVPPLHKLNLESQLKIDL